MIDQGNIVISAVKPNMVHMIWPLVEPMIVAAIEHSNQEMDIDDIFNRVMDSDMLLLTITENDRFVSCLVLEKRDFPTGKTICHVATCGGADMHLWLDDLLDLLDGLAKEQGCDEIYIIGRPGWKRVLSGKGYDVIHTVLSKKVG